LEARKREIGADLKVKQGDIEIAIHPNLPELYRRKVVRLQQILDDEATRPEAVEVLAFKEARAKCRYCLHEEICRRWLTVRVPGTSPQFCPNAAFFQSCVSAD
jgi:hypothetical protein